MSDKILVTGGTGYIGSHTVVELQQKGYEVVIADNLSNSNAGVVDQIAQITGIRPEFVKLDLCDLAGTKALFEQYNIKAVIHFAASKAVGESVQQPLMYYRNNTQSLINILEVMKEQGKSNFVFSSSCTVYGEPDNPPVRETDPTKPAESPYGNTKQIGEEIIRDTVMAGADFKAIALRYFNPIGAHDTALIGELPLGVPQNLMPYITQTAAGIREQLSVFGDDYETRDGTCIRDYIHVVDLAKAHVIAIERMMEENNKKPFEIFNLGTGNGYTVLEVIKSFEKTSGEQLNYKIAPRRGGDIEKIWADPAFANNELGWTAELGIDEMTGSAWKWQQKIEA